MVAPSPFPPELVCANVAACVADLGIISKVARPFSIPLDSFVGDKFLFLEVLRGEALRDRDSSAPAVMLRVTRAINNQTLSELCAAHLRRFDGISDRKQRADIVEALVGALIRGGEYENASALLACLFQTGAPPNLRYPNYPIMSGAKDLGEFSFLAVGALASLYSRLAVATYEPPVRELHQLAEELTRSIVSECFGTEKRPGVTYERVLRVLVECGVGAAFNELKAFYERLD